MNQQHFINNKFYFISAILYLLIPILLITGPFLPDLSLTFICLMFIFKTIKEKNISIYKNNFFIVFLFFYLILLISSFFSEYASYSSQRSIPYLRFGIFSLATYYIIKFNPKIIKYLVIIYLLILTLLSIDSLCEFIFGQNILGWKKLDSNFRVTSLFGNDEVLGSYVARFFPFIMSLILFNKEELNLNIKNYQISLIAIISFIITLISGERTSLAIITISIFLILLCCKNLRKIIILSMILILFLSSILISINPKLKVRLYDQVISQMDISNTDERIKVFSKTYEGHYLIAYNMFKEKPLIGHGVKSFRKYCSKPENFLYDNACTTHPHNTYMQLLAETGFFGFLIILSLFILASYKLTKVFFKRFFSKNLKHSDSLTMMYIFFFSNLFPFLPAGSFFNNWMSTIYFMPIGYTIFLYNKVFKQ
tara:strand:- start:8370 stop:9641 length:1272 start_codon:yes stop_codon:yes gene_type:complete